jgi:hypothetical protein
VGVRDEMMSDFKKFNDTLYISKGINFIASLELKPGPEDIYYDLKGWVLIVRERDCVHEKVLGHFLVLEDQTTHVRLEINHEPRSPEIKAVINKSFESRLWDSIESIILRSRELLEALEYE